MVDKALEHLIHTDSARTGTAQPAGEEEAQGISSLCRKIHEGWEWRRWKQTAQWYLVSSLFIVHKLKYKKHHLKVFFYYLIFLMWGWSNPRNCGGSILRDAQNATGHESGQSALADPGEMGKRRGHWCTGYAVSKCDQHGFLGAACCHHKTYLICANICLVVWYGGSWVGVLQKLINMVLVNTLNVSY